MKDINQLIFEILNINNLVKQVRNIKQNNPDKYNKIYNRTLNSSKKYAMLQHTNNLPKDNNGNIDSSSVLKNNKIHKNLQSILYNISPYNMTRN